MVLGHQQALCSFEVRCAIFKIPLDINSLLSNDGTWWERSRSSLMRQNHYLNQCWPIIKCVLWNSPQSKFIKKMSWSQAVTSEIILRLSIVFGRSSELIILNGLWQSVICSNVIIFVCQSLGPDSILRCYLTINFSKILKSSLHCGITYTGKMTSLDSDGPWFKHQFYPRYWQWSQRQNLPFGIDIF